MYVFHSAIAAMCTVQIYTFLVVCWTVVEGLCKKAVLLKSNFRLWFLALLRLISVAVLLLT